MLRCIGPLQANYIIREVHEGACGMHAGARSVVAKIMRQGYYSCSGTEVTKDTSHVHHVSMAILSMGSRHSRTPPRGSRKFIIVAIDYFTKWIEAKPLAKTHVKSWCEKWKIKQMNTAVSHPQANGLVERANKSLMHGLKARLGRERVGAVIPAEIGMPTYSTMHFNEAQNEEEMRLNIDLSQERRETAAIREAKYKKKVEQYYNKRVRPMAFRVGDFVLQKECC
ncbi:reverse transcriptase domain-containing protein [Tanacetum coccineum]